MFINIYSDDSKAVINFLKRNERLTQSYNVEKFEKTWSKWLGVKYSVFVNSGSSANLLTISAIKILYNPKEIIVPTLTWSSDIASLLHNNIKPKFVDIKLSNLAMDEEQIYKSITKDTKAVFITHAQGFNGLSQKLINTLKKKKIILIEDVCESHGATFKGKKLGTFGLISNFSFYYAHHMSTIEGGMICTNDKKIFRILKILRAHGMLREAGDKNYENKIIQKNKSLSPKFIFMYPAYNMRSNEIPAVIGLNQIKRLDKNNELRKKNLEIFLNNLNKKYYFTGYDLEGNSNYAFPLILNKKNKKNRNKLERIMTKNSIEFRRGNAGGGNQLRQPYLKKFIKNLNMKNFQNVDHVHFYGYYIGNYPSLTKSKILKICKILNDINYE